MDMKEEFQLQEILFPYSPSDFKVGEVFVFNIYHIVQVDDTCQLISCETIWIEGKMMKVKLTEIAQVIRSKNSGPYEITFDIIFKE